MRMAALTLDDIDRFGARLAGVSDVVCPYCGPQRKSVANQRRKVLRIWRVDRNFASWACARCGEHGYARDQRAVGLDHETWHRARLEAEAGQREAHSKRRNLALFLWSRRRPLAGSIGETYLRETRGYHGPIPATLGFLPPRADHPPAMIAAFGIPTEPEPGVLALKPAEIKGIHLTRLSRDGRHKAQSADGETSAKIMIGHSAGWPIVLAPMNDLLGLGIIEGIEKGLSVFAAFGTGVWVSGSASRMPALADKIPDYTDFVRIYRDDDPDGRRHAATLANLLGKRNLHGDVKPL
jgi:hypothetical protein